MPRKTSTKKSTLTFAQKKKKCDWGGYIRCDLDSDDKENYIDWSEKNAGDSWALLDELVETGLAVGISFDETEGTVTAKATFWDFDNMKVWQLTAFHQSGQEAVMILLFKHVVMLGRDWDDSIGGGMGENLFG